MNTDCTPGPIEVVRPKPTCVYVVCRAGAGSVVAVHELEPSAHADRAARGEGGYYVEAWAVQQGQPRAPLERNPMVCAFQVAFAEWDRRYRESPEQFWDVVTHLLRHTSASYGEACGVYFAAILDELAGGRPWAAIGK